MSNSKAILLSIFATRFLFACEQSSVELMDVNYVHEAECDERLKSVSVIEGSVVIPATCLDADLPRLHDYEYDRQRSVLPVKWKDGVLFTGIVENKDIHGSGMILERVSVREGRLEGDWDKYMGGVFKDTGLVAYNEVRSRYTFKNGVLVSRTRFIRGDGSLKITQIDEEDGTGRTRKEFLDDGHYRWHWDQELGNWSHKILIGQSGQEGEILYWDRANREWSKDSDINELDIDDSNIKTVESRPYTATSQQRKELKKILCGDLKC